MKIQTRCHVRWMIRSDLPKVLAIEQGTPDPWSDAQIIQTLRPRNQIGMVAEVGDQVVGWMTYRMEQGRICLDRLAVHPDCRRQGVGYTLLVKLLSKLKDGYGRNRLLIDVPEDNLAAQLWLRAAGVRASGVLPEAGCYRFEYVIPAPPKEPTLEVFEEWP